MGFKLDPTYQKVHDTPLAKFVRKETNDEGVITFFDSARGKWVLAYWVEKEHGFVHDVDDLDGTAETGPLPPEWLSKSIAQAGKNRGKFAEMRRALMEKDKAEFRALCDYHDEQRDLRTHLKKKTGQRVYFG